MLKKTNLVLIKREGRRSVSNHHELKSAAYEYASKNGLTLVEFSDKATKALSLVDQIKMFITRMGKNSKVLINGDINQDDLRGRSGLEFCMQKLDSVEGIGICRLSYEDIQRNDIIGRVLNALEN